MNTYSFPIQFADRLNVPADFPKFLKVVAANVRDAVEQFEKAVARHYAVSNPLRYSLGVYGKTEAERLASLESRGVVMEEGDTTTYKGRKFKTVEDTGYLSDLDTDPASAIAAIRDSRKTILRQYPSATDFRIDTDSDYDSSSVRFAMRFRRQETQAEADLRSMVEFFQGVANKREKLAQLAALKKELGVD